MLSKEEFRFLLSSVSQIFIVSAGILYILGFITLNSYFAALGFHINSFLNIRYLLAGIYSALLCGFSFYSAWVVYLRIRDVGKNYSGKEPASRFFSKQLLITVSGLFSISYLIYTILPLKVDTVLTQKHTFIFNKSDIIGRFIQDVLKGATPLFQVFTYWYLLILPVVILLAIGYALLFKQKSHENTEIKQVSTKGKPINHGSTVSKWQRVVDTLLFAFTLFTVVFLFVFTFVKESYYYVSPQTVGDQQLDFNALFIIIFPNVLLIGFYIFYVIKDKISFHDIRKRVLGQTTGTALLISYLLATIITFGKAVYPKIPYSMGGGSAKEVHMYARKDNKELYSTLTSAKNIYLIDNTDDLYLLVLHNSDDTFSSLEISKTAVDGFYSITN